RERVTGAVVLKTVAPGVAIGIAAKIRQDQERGLAGILGLTLDRLPHFRAEAVGSTDPIDVQRVCSRMRNVNVMHRDPQQTRRDLAHKLPSNIYGEFIRAGKGASVRLEIINRQL